MSGPPRITWSAIAAWEDHYGRQLDGEELDAIGKMDSAYCHPDPDATKRPAERKRGAS